MNRFITRSVVTLGLGAFLQAPSVSAAGTIYFQGRVVEPMCQIAVQGVSQQALPVVKMRDCSAWQAQAIQVQRQVLTLPAEAKTGRTTRDVPLYLVRYP